MAKKNKPRSLSGRNTRDVLRRARELGAEIQNRTGTGECVISDPNHRLQPVTINARKKPCARALSTWVMKLERLGAPA